MTPKQQRFVDEYIIDLNATQAAIRAEYSEKTAYAQGQRLLKNVEIARLIQSRMDDRAERTKIDADFVLQGIARNIARCEQGAAVTDRSGEPVMTEGPDGEVAPLWKYDAANALRGYELLGKHLKLFTDKIEHEAGDSLKTLAELMAETRDDTKS